MEHPIRFDAGDRWLADLRLRALALPGAVETITFGRPWFRAGKVFALYGSSTRGPDAVPHPHAVLVHVDDDERAARRQDRRFFVPAYFGPRGWLGLDLDDPALDRDELGELLDASYRHAAPARLVRALDAAPADQEDVPPSGADAAFRPAGGASS